MTAVTGERGERVERQLPPRKPDSVKSAKSVRCALRRHVRPPIPLTSLTSWPLGRSILGEQGGGSSHHAVHRWLRPVLLHRPGRSHLAGARAHTALSACAGRLDWLRPVPLRLQRLPRQLFDVGDDSRRRSTTVLRPRRCSCCCRHLDGDTPCARFLERLTPNAASEA